MDDIRLWLTAFITLMELSWLEEDFAVRIIGDHWVKQIVPLISKLVGRVVLFCTSCKVILQLLLQTMYGWNS